MTEMYMKISKNKPAPNKYYGFDTKGFDGTYIGSPVTNEKQFLKDIADHDWKCVCVDYDDAGVMARKEKAMLEFLDAKNNPEYYNASKTYFKKESRYFTKPSILCLYYDNYFRIDNLFMGIY